MYVKKIDTIEKCDAAIFFLTNKFFQSDKFKEEWSKRDNKVIFIILLDDINSSKIDEYLNRYIVSLYSDSIELLGKEEVIRINRVFLSRLCNLKKFNLNQSYIIDSNDLITKKLQLRNHLEQILIQTEIIGDNLVLLKTLNAKRQNEIIIIDLKNADNINKIADINVKKQEFCWISHLNKIFVYQKYISNLEKEENCSLFSETGNFIQSVFSIDNNIYEVNSISYSESNLEVYLNVYQKLDSKRLILILNNYFFLIKTIENNLINPNFNFTYSSQIELFNNLYNIFHYHSNIAFLQEIFYVDENKLDYFYNIYIFDKSSYSIVGLIETNHRLMMVFNDKMLLASKSGYIVQKILILKSSLPDCDAFCKLNRFKSHHLLSNPYLLPCGYSACLDCISNHYNLLKNKFKCEICNQEYSLPHKLDPAKISNEAYKMMIEQNKIIICNFGIFFNYGFSEILYTYYMV